MIRPVVAGLGIAATLAIVRWAPAEPAMVYGLAFVAASLVYLYGAGTWLGMEREGSAVFALAAVFIVARLSFSGAMPLGSDDVYRYMWDGRVQLSGINPYRFAPDDPALWSLHSERLPALVNHPEMRTIYFPLAQWSFALGYLLSGERVWAYQLLATIADLFTIVGLFTLLRSTRATPWRVLLYAASPLAILQYSLDAHVDALGLPFLVFGLLVYERGRTLPASALLGLSLLVKPVALVILPILALRERGIVKKLTFGAVALAVFAVPFIPYAISADPFDALGTFTRHWTFNGALFSLIMPLVADNRTARLWCAAVLVLALAFVYAGRRPWMEKVVLSVLLLLLCSPVAHLWYFGWLVALLPLAPLASGIVAAATVSVGSITYVEHRLLGSWQEHPWVVVLEYLPVVALLALELTGTDILRHFRKGQRTDDLLQG